MVDQRTLSAEHWYAVHCKPLKERFVMLLLKEQLGLAVYLPHIKLRRQGRTTSSPFFPGYLFVRADLSSAEGTRINTITGVISVVAIGGTPQPIAAVVIDAIRERVDALNLAADQPNRFRPGDTLLLTSGPLAGLEAVFIGPMRPTERVWVLIEFLHRQLSAEVPANVLQHIDESPQIDTDLSRRTRGRGRAIRGW